MTLTCGNCAETLRFAPTGTGEVLVHAVRDTIWCPERQRRATLHAEARA